MENRFFFIFNAMTLFDIFNTILYRIKNTYVNIFLCYFTYIYISNWILYKLFKMSFKNNSFSAIHPGSLKSTFRNKANIKTWARIWNFVNCFRICWYFILLVGNFKSHHPILNKKVKSYYYTFGTMSLLIKGLLESSITNNEKTPDTAIANCKYVI